MLVLEMFRAGDLSFVLCDSILPRFNLGVKMLEVEELNLCLNGLISPCISTSEAKYFIPSVHSEGPAIELVRTLISDPYEAILKCTNDIAEEQDAIELSPF